MKQRKGVVIMIIMIVAVIGCSDMIDSMAHVRLTMTIEDHDIPVDSQFTLYGTREGSSEQITQVLGSVTNVTLLPLRSGTWTLRVEATVDGVLKGDGTVTVTVKPGATVPAAIDMAYRYNVTFDADGGSELSMTGKDVVYDAPYGVLATATKAGYTLAGWYTEQNGGGTRILEDTEVSIVTSQTLYAKWSANTNTAYTVEHYQQDVCGAGYTKTDMDNEIGTTGTTATASSRSYTGFTENTAHADRVASGTIVGDGSLILKLYYDRDVFGVNFVENGGSAVSNLAEVRYGSTVPAPAAPTRTGYGFGGWYKESGLTNAWLFASDVVTATTNLYAKWIVNTYQVSYDANDATSGTVPDAQVKTYGADLTLATNTKSLARTGHTFAGWNTAANGSGTNYAEGAIYDDNVTLTLYAKWSANTYTVTFDANGGSGSMEAQNFTYGTPANLIANTFTKTGYDFAGWATSASGSKEYDDQDSYPTPATNTTLYAKWSANTYNITYNLNGGTNGDNPATYTIETAEITMLAPTRTGYTFGGWFADSDFSGSAVTTIAQGSTGDRTLYAKWTFNVFTGPAGGLVFYENPTHATDDWRYLEAAPYGWDYGAIDSIGIYFGSIGVYYHDNSDDDPTFQWGAFGYAVEPPATATGVGSGEINTANIVTYHNGLGDYYLDPTSYCANNDGTVAAKVCADYSLENGGVTYDDWFLPSKDELYLMHSNLALHGLGGISDGYGYWSSSEVDDDGYYAWYEVVYDGEYYEEVWVERKIGARVRPIRAYY